MTDKKHFTTITREHNEHRKKWGKVFTHTKSGEKYQLLRTAHDTESQECMALFCLVENSMYQFVTPIAAFLAKHDEAH